MPYLVGLYRDDFETGEFGSWFRIFTFVFTFLTGILAAVGCLLRSLVLQKIASACLALGVFAVVFNVLFGLRLAAVVLCNGDIKDACMEPNSGCGVVGAPVRDWQAFLFSFTLCVLLCSLSVTTRLLLRESLIEVGQHLPELVNQSALDASVTHDNSSGKRKTESVEKADLLEPVFVPVKPREGATKDLAATFAKESDNTELVSSKDFEGSLGHSGSLRGRGRGRKK